MKKKTLMGMVLVLVSSLVLGGCARGVSQETYDAVLAERDAAQGDLATAEVEVETLQADLTTTEAEVETLQADLAEKQNQVESLYLDHASLKTEHSQLEARYNQLLEDYRTLRPEYEEPSPSALPITITAGNLDITLKEAYITERIANFGPLGRFVVLTIEVTNIGRTEEYIFAASFLIIGSERRLYRSYDFGYDPPTGFVWRYETITAEATLECKLAFDVPADERDLYVLVTIEEKIELWPSVALGL